MILVDTRHAAALLLELRETMRTIPELPDGLRPASWEEAYAIQDALHEAAGWEIGALKAGCTSEVSQAAVGVDEPIAGRLPVTAILDSPARVPRAMFHHVPILESELALRLAVDVIPDSDVVTDDQVRCLVDLVAPALELVDSRFDEILGASGPSLVADNSAASAIVLGRAVAIDDVTDLATIRVSLRAGHDELASGTGAAALGNPLRSLRWLLGHEQRRGRTVKAGTWVMTGTLTGLTPCPAGRSVTASFVGVGDVSFELDL
ncbi:MAG: 2-keto-4-pentenoate hydratase [Acidimicrobiales bacterium]